MEGLKVSKANLVVYLHPSKANKVQQAILRQLSSLLFQFSEAFDGVVLAYDVKIRSRNAKILTGICPYFGVKLKAELLLFTPKPNMLLEGKVVKLGKESIHVIVLGFSSATITFEDIREEFKYKLRHGEGVYTSKFHKRHVIKVGSMLRFLVKSFDEEILHISGSLIPTHTGCIRWLHKHATEEGSLMDRSAKEQRKSDMEMEMNENDPGVNDGGSLFSKTDLRHKSKRRRTAEYS
ncbi:DNA-directed RNA polymerase isoform X2 [Tasmannia lanceolata]|uniref:DNA-directed RNA polymerase isoform X2 n=1 Tax=Tasmannia lanceolata TaxID=3420 RepID=UPI00406384FF